MQRRIVEPKCYLCHFFSYRVPRSLFKPMLTFQLASPVLLCSSSGIAAHQVTRSLQTSGPAHRPQTIHTHPTPGT